MGPPDLPGTGGGAGAGGAAPRAAAAGAAVGVGDLGVDYAWLQAQLAELSKQLSSVGLEDEFEDEVGHAGRGRPVGAERGARPSPTRVGRGPCSMRRP
jgi:hypothetical protein